MNNAMICRPSGAITNFWLYLPFEGLGRLRRNFDHVLERRSLTANDYTRRTNIEFENDESRFAYLQTLRDFLFADGPYPEFEG